MSTVTWSWRSGVRAMPVASVGRVDVAARSAARSLTVSSNLLRGAMASTRPHSSACWPLTPSARVAKTSARSRRTWRLSTTRVRPPVPGQDGEQRDLREAHGAGSVVDEDDLVARQGQLVAAAGRGAVDGRDPRLAGVGRGVLDRVAGLVRELAEGDLVGVGRPGEHLDVGAGAEDLVEPAGDDHGAHLGMLEAQALDGVVELDVDAEVVAVELQLVVVAQAGVGRDPHRQGGDRAVEGQLPVAVGGRLGGERDHGAPLGLSDADQSTTSRRSVKILSKIGRSVSQRPSSGTPHRRSARALSATVADRARSRIRESSERRSAASAHSRLVVCVTAYVVDDSCGDTEP